MEKLTNQGYKYYLSSDRFGQAADRLPLWVKLLQKSFTSDFNISALIDTWGKKMGLEGGIILAGHGSLRRGRWTFRDGQKRGPTQDLINFFDGKAAFIGIYSCNPGNVEITSQKSIVIHPASNVKLSDIRKGKDQYRVFVPGLGYINEIQEALGVVEKLVWPTSTGK